ncbi:transglycosylase SLT domain-containing protein [Thermodesulfobacteriota bacterium]
MQHIIIKKIFTVLLFAAILVSGAATPLEADIYRYIDKNGVHHFTNTPTSAVYSVYFKIAPEMFSKQYSPDRYNHIITQASRTHGIDVPLIKAVIKVESNFNPRAISKAGARGLMQIMPTNYRALQIQDPFDPHQNIMGGARYLRTLLNRFDGNIQFALAAYNAGPTSVARHNKIPPNKETREFVRKVMKYYSVFKREMKM